MNYLVTKKLPNDLTRPQEDKLKSISKYYVWDYLHQMIRMCVPKFWMFTYINFLSLLCMWWSLGSKKNGSQGTWEWILLAYFIQSCIYFLQIMWSLSKSRLLGCKKSNASNTHIYCSDLWCLGDWFNGTISSFIW